MKAKSSFQRSLTLHLLLGFGTVVALGCFIFGWATFTEISGAVIASGKLTVDSNVKKVQHPTGGVVGDLMVKDGDHVKKGDVVAHLKLVVPSALTAEEEAALRAYAAAGGQRVSPERGGFFRRKKKK